MRMLPQGGHGVNAPQVGPEHAATMLIGLAAEKAVHAPVAVMDYASLTALKGDFGGRKIFAEALELILSDQELAEGVETVRICRSWKEATIFYQKGERRKVTKFAPSDRPETGYGFPVSVDLSFSGGFLSQLALELAEDVPVKWGPPPKLSERESEK